MIEAYPLQWPPGIPRTKTGHHEYARWSKDGRRLTLADALQRLDAEVRLYTRMGRTWRIPPDSVVVNCDLRTRKSDGMPYSNARDPDDPGVAVYFQFDGEPRCIPCDKFTRLADNIAGVAAALGHLRGLERHVNAGAVNAAFTGFAALPETINEHWRQVLGLPDVANVTPEIVKRAHKTLAQRNHPDRGGSDQQMARINMARDQALSELAG